MAQKFRRENAVTGERGLRKTEKGKRREVRICKYYYSSFLMVYRSENLRTEAGRAFAFFLPTAF
jgi:hypothetical protein